MSGWIKLYRGLLDWEWYDDANATRLFIHCLLKANHEDKNYRGEVVKRGSFLTGRDLLSKETGLSVRSIRTSLSKLKSTNELTIKSTNKGTVVTIVKYSDFQFNDSKATSKPTNEPTNERPASDQQATTNKNDKNIRSKEEERELPFSSPEFSQAWNEWNLYRKEKRTKLTPSTIKKQLTQLKKLNESDAIYTINLSITNGWTGLFPDKATGPGNGPNQRVDGTFNEGRTFGERPNGNPPKKSEDLF